MGSYDAAADVVAKLEAQGVAATRDPRAATPPCVLVGDRGMTYDSMCGGTVAWELLALAPGPFNADAWQALDVLEAAVRATLPVEARVRVAYRLALDNPPLPAYLFTYSAGIDL